MKIINIINKNKINYIKEIKINCKNKSIGRIIVNINKSIKIINPKNIKIININKLKINKNKKYTLVKTHSGYYKGKKKYNIELKELLKNKIYIQKIFKNTSKKSNKNNIYIINKFINEYKKLGI